MATTEEEEEEEEEEGEAPLLENKLSPEERETQTRGSSTAPLRASEKGGTGGGNLWELMGAYRNIGEFVET